MSILKIGGFSNKSDIPDIQGDMLGMFIPQILSIQSPVNKKLLEIEIKKKDINSAVIEKGLLIPAGFPSSGKIKFRTKSRAGENFKNYITSIDNINSYFLIFLRLIYDVENLNFKIPNFGRLLAGDLTSKSLILTEQKTLSLKELVLPVPNFEIHHIEYDKTSRKGRIISIPNISLKISQNFRATRFLGGSSKVSDNISKLKSELVISHNTIDRRPNIKDNEIDKYIKYIQPVLINENIQIRRGLANESGNAFKDDKLLPPQTINNFLNFIDKFRKNNGVFIPNEKIFGSRNNSINNTDIKASFLVPEKFYTMNYINLLFLMIISEAINEDKSIFTKDNIYIIFEYLLNKIYYAIKNKNNNFTEGNILVNKNFDITRNITKTEFASTLNKIIIRDNAKKLFYQEYKENFNTSNRINPDIARIYKKLSTENINSLMDKIYHHATFCKDISNLLLVQDNNISLKRKIFDL